MESHGHGHRQHLKESINKRELSTMQRQRSPVLSNNIVRDALAALHLSLPPGREEAMVVVLQ